MMTVEHIIALANDQRARSKTGRAHDSDLAKTNAEQADRINALLTEAEQANATIAEQAQRITALEAERDTWRKQALEENAAADAATETKKTRKRGK